MRWETKYPEYGDERIVKRFLLFPLTIGKETRWLEFTSWHQLYCGVPYADWKDICWEELK